MVNWGKLIFGGVDSSDYGIYITGEGVYNAPERAVEFVDVPGRNGAIAIDQGRFNNITITYPSGTFGKTQEEFREAVSDFRNAIMALRGYQKLEDTYHPDEYRMAVYTAGLEVSPVHYGQAGEFGITFECKPQRWLNCGDYPVPIKSGESLSNPTQFGSNPVLFSEGYGLINFNGFEIGLENEPIGHVTMDNINKSIDTHDTSVSFSMPLKYRWEPGDDITIFNSYTSFQRTLIFDTNGETVSNLEATSLVNCRLTDWTGVNLNEDIFISWVDIRPTDNIELSYGTALSKTFSVTISFDIGSSSHSFSFSTVFAYDGDDEITVTMSLTKLSGDDIVLVDTSNKNNYWLVMAKWEGNSTYPVWSQDYDYVVIDCDIGEAYAVEGDDIVSLNQWVNFGSDLPTLKPGGNKITYDNTIMELKIKPRWWRI